MKFEIDDFKTWKNRRITLLGMSGVGKTYLSNILMKANWFHYSGDYRIGTRYLDEPILDNIKQQAMQVPFLRELLRSDSIYICNNITVNNLQPVSSFLGKLGNPELGGLPLDEFKRRQRLHREAEIAAMKDIPEFIRKAREIYGYEHFINDAGGSICELGDPEALSVLAEHTLILYLKPDPATEQAMIQRAIDHPKPMYYHEAFLDEQLATYLRETGVRSADEIHPDDFVRWIFPRLLAHRRPLYEALADEHGYTIDARAAEAVESEADFLELVGAALG